MKSHLKPSNWQKSTQPPCIGYFLKNSLKYKNRNWISLVGKKRARREKHALINIRNEVRLRRKIISRSRSAVTWRSEGDVKWVEIGFKEWNRKGQEASRDICMSLEHRREMVFVLKATNVFSYSRSITIFLEEIWGKEEGCETKIVLYEMLEIFALESKRLAWERTVGKAKN